LVKNTRLLTAIVDCYFNHPEEYQKILKELKEEGNEPITNKENCAVKKN
jgi:hypothetical protein